MGERISRHDVAHVARLARMSLTDAELVRFTEQLGAILDHAADVAALDTTDVALTAHPLPLRNVLRDDEVVASLDRDEVLAQAPAVEDGRIRVPRIITPSADAESGDPASAAESGDPASAAESGGTEE